MKKISKWVAAALVSFVIGVSPALADESCITPEAFLETLQVSLPNVQELRLYTGVDAWEFASEMVEAPVELFMAYGAVQILREPAYPTDLLVLFNLQGCYVGHEEFSHDHVDAAIIHMEGTPA